MNSRQNKPMMTQQTGHKNYNEVNRINKKKDRPDY